MTKAPPTRQLVNRAASHPSKLAEIQVLRGLSILSVLLCHLSITPTVLGMSAAKIRLPFHLGVEIFFIISGYVITHSLARDGFNGGRFLVKRAFRLIPTLLTLIVISYGLNCYFQNSSLSEGMKSLFSVPERAFWEQSVGTLGGFFILLEGPVAHCYSAMWSLSIEDQFYAALAGACLVAGLLGSYRKRAIGPMICAVALVLYICLTAARLGRCLGYNLDLKLVSYLVYWRFEFIAIGIILAFADAAFKQRFNRAFQASGNLLAPLLLLMPFGLAALSGEENASVALPFKDDFLLIVCGLSFGLLVWLAANSLCLPKTRGPIYRMVAYFGDRSYTLYVMHYTVFAVAWLIMKSYIPAAFASSLNYGVCQLLLTAAILLPLAEAVYRWIELPLSHVGRRLAMRLSESQPCPKTVTVNKLPAFRPHIGSIVRQRQEAEQSDAPAMLV